jgi:hypothetical protein
VPTALLTGAPTHAGAATAMLERRGYSVIEGSPVSAPHLQCYLQLPATGRAGRDLAARLDTLVAVAAHLDRRATVLLVVDDSDGGRAGGSTELLVALALVVLEDYGRADARVAVLALTELYEPAFALASPSGARAGQ